MIEIVSIFIFLYFLMSIVIFQELATGNEGMANPEAGDENLVHKQFHTSTYYTINNVVYTLRFPLFEDDSRLLQFTDVLTTTPDFMTTTNNIDNAHFPLAYQLGEIIRLGPYYNFAAHPEMEFYHWYANMPENLRHSIANAGWKARKLQFGEQYIIAGYAFAAFLVGALALAVLKGKVRTVYGQVNPTNQRMILFKQNLPGTYLPAVYRALYGAGNLTDDQMRNYFNSILQLLNDHNWALPKESYEICDKIEGSYMFKLPLDPKLKIDTDQRIDFVILSTTSSAGPTFTGTVADDNLILLLDSLTYFFSDLQIISQEVEYNSQFQQPGLFQDFKTKYAPIPLDYTFLVSWPQVKVPFYIPFLRTNYYTANLRYQLQNDSRYQNTLGDGNHNWLVSLENHSAEQNISNYYVRMRILPGFTEEEMEEMLIVGNYFFGGLFNDHFAFTNSDQMSQPEQNAMACVMERITVNDKNQVIKREAISPIEANSVYNWNELPANNFLSLWNKTEHDPWRNLFLLRIVDAGTNPINPVVVDTTQLPVMTGDNELTIVKGNYDVFLDEQYGMMNFEAKNFYIKFANERMLRFINPFVAPPQEREPEGKSGISAATWSDIKEPSKLNAYIADLEAKIKYSNDKGAKDKAEYYSKLVADVKKLITKLEESKENKEQIEPPKTPPPGDGQSADLSPPNGT